MTTWYENELLSEVFWFRKKCAIYPSIALDNTLILHSAPENRGEDLTSGFFGERLTSVDPGW